MTCSRIVIQQMVDLIMADIVKLKPWIDYHKSLDVIDEVAIDRMNRLRGEGYNPFEIACITGATVEEVRGVFYD